MRRCTLARTGAVLITAGMFCFSSSAIACKIGAAVPPESIPDASVVYTRKQAFRASTGKIVLHYGTGIDGAPMMADILRKDCYPAIAVAGGKPGTVSIFVHRGYPVDYRQIDLDNGRLGGTSSNIFDDRVGKPEGSADYRYRPK